MFVLVFPNLPTLFLDPSPGSILPSGPIVILYGSHHPTDSATSERTDNHLFDSFRVHPSNTSYLPPPTSVVRTRPRTFYPRERERERIPKHYLQPTPTTPRFDRMYERRLPTYLTYHSPPSLLCERPSTAATCLPAYLTPIVVLIEEKKSGISCPVVLRRPWGSDTHTHSLSLSVFSPGI